MKRFQVSKLIVLLAPLLTLVLITAQLVSASPAQAKVRGLNGRIAFGRYDPTVQDFHIFTVKPDGTDEKQLLPGVAECPTWSPDGKRILFQSFGSFPDGTTPQLYTMWPDGTHLLQLTTNERNSWPAWSPDGTKIIFVHRSTTEADQNAHLYVMNADGSGLLQLTHNPFWQLQPAWSSATA